ncbi:MAG: ABC transporter substrate-binding protein [Planctomycetota bacterium]|jgi:ABC-type transport system substrate-binding protein
MKMHISKQRLYAIAIVIAISGYVFTLAGCGDSPSGEDGEEMVLNHALATRLTGLDPGDQRNVTALIIKSQIFEPLYQYHFLKRPYQLVPLLAEDMPDIGDDNLTYTIRIKKNVYFQDDKCFPGGKGREVKAQDFVFAIKRIANIKNLSQNWSIFDDKIVGLDGFREYTKTCEKREDVDYSKEVEGLQTPDDYTLVIKLKRPWPQLLTYALSDTATAPVAKETVDLYGKDIMSHPVGTGPFKLKEWRRRSFIVLVRNPTFRGEPYPSEGESGDEEAGYLDDAGKMMPFADRVVWTVIEEDQPRWFLFLQGKLDASAIPKDNWSDVITGGSSLTPEMKRRGIHLKSFLDPTTFFLGFNMQDPVLGNNKPLRLAISRAIDREKFIELFRNNRDVVAHGIVPPLMASYDPNIKEKGYARYDPTEAQSLLKEAEKVHGGKLPTLKIAVPGTDTFFRQFGQFFKRQLDAVNLAVELDYMDGPTYWEKLNTGSLQMFASGTGATLPDAQDLLQSFYSKYWAPGANSFNYASAEFDRLYEKIAVMFDSPERRELYRKMELVVLEDCPAVFLNHRVAYALHHDWYKNYKPNVFTQGLSKYRRIDMKKRAAYRELLKKIK